MDEQGRLLASQGAKIN